MTISWFYHCAYMISNAWTFAQTDAKRLTHAWSAGLRGEGEVHGPENSASARPETLLLIGFDHVTR